MIRNPLHILIVLILLLGSFYLGSTFSNKKDVTFPIYIKDRSAQIDSEIIKLKQYNFDTLISDYADMEILNTASCIEIFLDKYSQDGMLASVVGEEYLKWIDNKEFIESYCLYVMALMNVIDTLDTSTLSTYSIPSDKLISKYTQILFDNFFDTMKRDDWFLGLAYYYQGVNSISDAIYYQNLVKAAELDFEPAIGALVRWYFFYSDTTLYSQEMIDFSIKKLEKCRNNTPIDQLEAYSTEGLVGAYNCHFMYAKLLTEGDFYDQDLNEAMGIFRWLAGRNHPEADYELSRIYCTYISSSDKNYNQSKLFLEKAISEIGYFNFYVEKYERLMNGYCGYDQDILKAQEFLNLIASYFPDLDQAKWFYSYQMLSFFSLDYDKEVSILTEISKYNYESSVSLALFYLGNFFPEDSYIGIGVEWEEHPEGLLIIDVLDNQPAHLAGIRKGDIVYKIGEENFESFLKNNSNALSFGNFISGKKGDEVIISVIRGSSRKIINFSLSLDVISYYQPAKSYYDPDLAKKILIKALNQDHSFDFFMPGTAEYHLGNIFIYHEDYDEKKVDLAINYYDKACELNILMACSELIYIHLSNEDFRDIDKAAYLTAKKFILNEDFDKAMEAHVWANDNELSTFGDLVDTYVESNSDSVIRIVAGIAVSASDYISEKIIDIPQAKNDTLEMTRIFDEYGVMSINKFKNYDDITAEDLRTITQMWGEFSEEDNAVISIIEGNGTSIEKTSYLSTDLIFYYSGHGISYNGINYLVPVDFPQNVKNFEEARPYLVSFNKIVKTWTEMNPKGQNIFILDACRTISTTSSSNDDFFLSSKDGVSFLNDSKLGPLAPTQTGSNAMIIYSTSPGKPAYYKQEGENSIFTKSLVRAFDQTPANSLQDIMLTVQEEVKNETNSNQIPWVETSLTKKFYLSQ